MFDLSTFAKATILFGVSWLLLALSAAAYPINDLSLYEKVYVSGVLSQKPMTILEIDKANNRVKVAGEDGFAKWVPASRIKSKFEKTAERGNQIVGTALITQCVFQYENCDSAKLGRMIYNKEYKIGDPFPAKGGGFAVKKGERAKPIEPAPDFSYNPLPKPTPKPAPKVAAKPAYKPAIDTPWRAETLPETKLSKIFVANACDEAITVLDMAVETAWAATRPSKFEAFDIYPGERRIVSINSRTDFSDSASLHMVAKSASHNWQGNRERTMDGWVNRYMKMNIAEESAGVRLTTLTCPKG